MICPAKICKAEKKPEQNLQPEGSTGTAKLYENHCRFLRKIRSSRSANWRDLIFSAWRHAERTRNIHVEYITLVNWNLLILEWKGLMSE